MWFLWGNSLSLCVFVVKLGDTLNCHNFFFCCFNFSSNCKKINKTLHPEHRNKHSVTDPWLSQKSVCLIFSPDSSVPSLRHTSFFFNIYIFVQWLQIKKKVDLTVRMKASLCLSRVFNPQRGTYAAPISGLRSPTSRPHLPPRHPQAECHPHRLKMSSARCTP